MLDISKTACAALAACAIMALAGCTPGGAGPGEGGATDGDAAASVAAVASGGALAQNGGAGQAGGGPMQPGPAPMPMEARRGEGWDTIRYAIGLIGKAPGEIDEELDYYRFRDGSEAVFMGGYEGPSDIRFGFSGGFREEGSKCVSLEFPALSMLERRGGAEGAATIGAVRSQFGIDPEYFDDGGTQYWRYDFEDIEIIIFVKGDGATLFGYEDLDKYTIIRRHGAVLPTADHAKAMADAVNPKGARAGAEWAGANIYIGRLWSTLQELEMETGRRLEAVETGGGEHRADDAGDGTRYWFNEGGECYLMRVEAGRILPAGSAKWTHKDLSAYWGGPAYRGDASGETCVFSFEDSVVSMGFTGEGGAAGEGGSVYVRGPW